MRRHLVPPPASGGLAGKDNAAEMRAFYTENWGKPVAAIPPWGPNCAHTDGEAYGDRFPPYLFLLFAHQDQDGFSAGIATCAGSALFNGAVIPAICIFAVTVSPRSPVGSGALLPADA